MLSEVFNISTNTVKRVVSDPVFALNNSFFATDNVSEIFSDMNSVIEGLYCFRNKVFEIKLYLNQNP